jgi:hypothetical protein
MVRYVLSAGIVIPPEAKGIKFHAGLVLPSKMVLTKDHEGYDIEAVIALDADAERYVCQEFWMRQREGGPPVTGEAIRAVPIQQLVKTAIRLAHLEKKGPADADGVVPSGLVPGAKPPEGLAKQGPTDEVLRWVAQTYNLAEVINEPPTKTVQDQLGISRATAGRWVAEARKRGLISPLDEDGD